VTELVPATERLEEERSETAVELSPETTPEQLPDGVRGRFDSRVLRDYTPAIESADPMMHVQLAPFEGPLDLLLYIIRRDAIDVFDIPISPICEAYLQAIDEMRDLNLDVAAEFLLMAATLAHIKSKMLLPRDGLAEDQEEEEGDPRVELVRRLLEYQKYRQVAQVLAGRARLGREIFGRPPPTSPDSGAAGGLVEMNAMELVAVLGRMLTRSKKEMVHEIFAERMSVGARINELVEVLRLRDHITYSELLDHGETPMVLTKRVVTFLALLEMARLRLVRLHQPSVAGTIYVTPIRENLEIDAGEIESSFDQAPAEPSAEDSGSEDVQ